jgi:hypothetical protein
MKKLLLTKVLMILAIFLAAQTDILPPVLVSPTDGDDDQVPDVELDWYASSGIGQISYELQLDTSADFTNPIIFNVDVSSLKTADLLFGTTHYWRVRATDDLGTSDWSETFSFITFDQFDLSKPTNAATAIAPRVKLIWKAKLGAVSITGITHYDYQISLDTNFSALYASGSVPFGTFPADTAAYFAWVGQLEFDTTYYWRARARHSQDESQWSERFSFTTIDVVTQVAPANSATDQMIDITLEWAEVEGVFEYIYEFCTDPNFTIPCMSISESNTANPQGVMFGTTYYWRVKASHTQDTSEWSPTWSFETINTVYPSDPENNSYVDDMFPTLEWEPITGVAGLEILFDISENFDNDPELFEVEGEESSYDILTALEYDQTYFWKLRAFENGDTTNWSETWSFTVGVSGIGDLIDQNSLQIYPNPAQNVLYIRSLNADFQNAELTVSNLLGQSILSQDLSFDQRNTKETISLDALDNGLYILQIKSGESTYTKKIIVEK